MMNHPKIISAKAIDDHSLLVEFDNHQKKTYDINPLLEKETFAPLRNAALFRAVRVDVGGYEVVWLRILILVNMSCGFMERQYCNSSWVQVLRTKISYATLFFQ